MCCFVAAWRSFWSLLFDGDAGVTNIRTHTAAPRTIRYTQFTNFHNKTHNLSKSHFIHNKLSYYMYICVYEIPNKWIKEDNRHEQKWKKKYNPLKERRRKNWIKYFVHESIVCFCLCTFSVRTKPNLYDPICLWKSSEANFRYMSPCEILTHIK